MIRFFSAVVLLTLCCPLETSAQDSEPKSDEGWIQLFNGKDLSGWIPKIRYHKAGENPGNTFRVEDGVLKVAYEPEVYETFGERFGHLFYERPFSHYRLRVEYRFVGEQCPGGPGWAIRNSGLMLHGESPETMAVDQDFPASIEVQLLGGTGRGKRTTANLCTPYTHVEMNGKLFQPHCTSSRSETYHGEQWVTCEVEVRGNEVIRHFVNGEEVLSYEKPQLDESKEHGKELAELAGGVMLSSGTISLQSESHPVEYRKVELLELPSQ